MEDRKWNQYANKNWNPYTGDKTDDGKCEIVKRYGKMACWACSQAYRLKGRAGYDKEDPFKPTFHPDRLDEPIKRKKPTIYATCFMGDIAYCKCQWMFEIIGVIRQCPKHTFLMLTKLPKTFGIKGDNTITDIPNNVWFGTTVNLQSEVHRIDDLRKIDCKNKWASFEAPFEEIQCDLTGIDGIAIGALTGKVKFQPKDEWIINLMQTARKCGTKIVLKDNLEFKDKNGIKPIYREWP